MISGIAVARFIIEIPCQNTFVAVKMLHNGFYITLQTGVFFHIGSRLAAGGFDPAGIVLAGEGIRLFAQSKIIVPAIIKKYKHRADVELIGNLVSCYRLAGIGLHILQNTRQAYSGLTFFAVTCRQKRIMFFELARKIIYIIESAAQGNIRQRLPGEFQFVQCVRQTQSYQIFQRRNTGEPPE